MKPLMHLLRLLLAKPGKVFGNLYLLIPLLFFSCQKNVTEAVRQDILLNEDWLTVANDTNKLAFEGFEKAAYEDSQWQQVDVPHNWDKYQGSRQLRHGNRHGYAWYRKKVSLEKKEAGKRYFLWFEGVSSYATVWLNEEKVGEHAGGRTSFTIDITDAITDQQENILSVRADHPSFIADLPWVCGGCSGEWGFSEGSQPMGIFRPVHLIVTKEVRVEPFGVHIWNDDSISEKSTKLYIDTEVKNYSVDPKEVEVVSTLIDPDGNHLTEQSEIVKLLSDSMQTIRQEIPEIINPRFWSVESPMLYTLVSEIKENGEVIDRTFTPYGIRWISWPIDRDGGGNQFFLNGNPFFINGICEYEHNLGQSHAFSNEEIIARAEQMKAAGFNAFRDGHQPHNLLYQKYWDENGMLFWTQFSAHIWYDTPEFRENFKKLLREWVKERRNSPSVILWGLQNESVLPEDFAKECVEIIREMDPTTSSQRKVTTCNGGVGTDWNVVQNWSGTYAGDPYVYGEELSQQTLNGEYGAWRSIDFHTEGPFVQEGPQSEDRMTALMEMKVRQAESVRDKCAGQFHWLFSSHENPGRIQNGEGYRDIDKVGPVNYKGLLTPWGEPLDVYYMYRSNYASGVNEPMVYIVSHTWPDRWTKPGIKDSIIVYSNCEEVELFNDVDNISLGKRTRGGIGTHFQWDSVNVRYNVLYAIGYNEGKAVAKDYIVLSHLPDSPGFEKLKGGAQPLTLAHEGLNYIYRVNCGGPDYTDENGQLWMADTHKSSKETWGSLSWTDEYPELPHFFASQRRTFDPISGTNDWLLFQTFRYGIDKLRYEFPVPDGEYQVELYFTEPWYGTGGGLNCKNWRLFDVAINDETVIRDLDIWSEAGHDTALKKTVKATVTGGQLVISFPKITSGQGLISAIAIATSNTTTKAALASPAIIMDLTVEASKEADQWSVQRWLDTGVKQYEENEVKWSNIPSFFYASDWIRRPDISYSDNGISVASFLVSEDAEVYIAMDRRIKNLPKWLDSYQEIPDKVFNDQDGIFRIYKKEFPKGEKVTLGEDGMVAEGKTYAYSVVVRPKAHFGEVQEARPVQRFDAEDVVLQGKFLKDNFRNEDYVRFTESSKAIEWEVNPGLAGTYLIRFRYMNLSEKPVIMQLKIVAADGRIMRDDQIAFPPAPEKWKVLSTTTGSTINAGHYKLILEMKGTDGLWIDALEFE